MQIIAVNQTGQVSDKDLHRAIAVLERGGVIGYPTETLYGLGVDSTNAAAVNHLFQVKNRLSVPVSIMLDSVESLLAALVNPDAAVEKLVRAFLPGELTIVGKCNLDLAAGIPARSGLTGMRVPNHALDLALVKTLGRPITSTSANLSGFPSALNIETVIAYFNDQIELLFDQGTLRHSPGSTVLDISQRPFKILREGAIKRTQLEPYLV